MEVGGLGGWEIIVVVTVFLLVFGVPVVAIVALVLFFNRRKRSNPSMKKCAFCAYSIPVGAAVCQFCGREAGQ